MEKILREIVEKYNDALDDRQRLKALLMDYFPKDRVNCNLLLMAYDEKIYTGLKSIKTLNRMIFNRCVSRITVNYGVAKELAESAVLAWAYALDVDVEKEPNAEIPATPKHTPIVSPIVTYTQGNVQKNNGNLPKKGSKPAASVPHVQDNANDYEIEKTTQGIILKKFVGFDEPEIVIPNSIDGNPVYKIGDEAFKGCANIQRIVISEGIKYIGNSAFFECNALTSITIPGSVQSIGEFAFSGCFALTSITIPGSVQSIGEFAFSRCFALTSIIIPDSVQTIGDDAFSWCRALTSIIIPDSVQTIGKLAFSGCSALTSIIIPSSVQSIGDNAFSWCRALTSITIPSSVQSIGDNAFDGCKALTIYCNAGSDALRYAREHGITCKT